MDRKKVKKRLFFWYSLLWVFIIISLYQSYLVYFVDTTSTISKWVGLVAGSISILLATCKISEISFYENQNPIFDKIIKYFNEGINLFNSKINRVVIFALFLVSLILFKTLGLNYIIIFLAGGLFSLIANLVSSKIMVQIMTRTSQFYKETNELIHKLMLNSGIAVTCFSLGFLLVPLVILFHIYKDYQLLNAFVFGAVIFSIINNIAIAVSSHSVNSSSNVVSDIYENISQNDKRNPMILLNGITSGILGVNLFNSDMFVTISAVIVCAMTVGAEFLQLMGAFLPIIIVSSGVFSTVVILLLFNPKSFKNPIVNILSITFFQAILFNLISYYLIHVWLPDLMVLEYAVLLGSAFGILSCFLYVKNIFINSKTSIDIANTAINGYRYSSEQVLRHSFFGVSLPAILCAFFVVCAFLISDGVSEPSIGLYGIMLSIIGFVSSVGIVVAMMSFSYATCNVDKIIDAYQEDIKELNGFQQNFLSDYGNKLLLLGKTYLNMLSILAGISIFIAYSILVGLDEIDLINPYVLTSMILGIFVPYLFCGFVLKISSKTTRRLVLEVKRQFRNFPQILRYELRPDYESCVELSALNSSLQVLVGLVIVVLIEAFVVIKFDIEALGGFIFAIILSSFGIIFMSNSSSIISKTAKKYFKSQFDYIKSSRQIDVLSYNESIFLSVRNLIVPSLNSLVKFVAILALTLIPLFNFS